MKNKVNIIIIGIVSLALLIGLGFLFSMLFGDKSNQSVQLPDHEFENWNESYEFPSDSRQQSLSMFDENIEIGFDELVKLARTGKISLVSELWRMRRKCPPTMERFECNSLLRQYLLEKFPEPGNKKLADLFVKYLKYEEEMAEYYIPGNLTLEERYERIRSKRRKFFGDGDASLLFGLEESKYDFTVSLKKFKTDNSDLSGDEKIAAYEKMKKQVYGDYYDAVVAKEPAFIRFQTEVSLRDNDFNKLNETGKSLLTRELRVKYFGDEAAKRMEKVDGFLANERASEEALRKAETKLLKDNPELTGAKKDQKLKELRIKHLGSEEAANAWDRRQKLMK